ncbi:recombinase family protein [Chloroflexota bacterium]
MAKSGRYDYDIISEFIEEGESAKTVDRPILKALTKYCTENRKKVDALLIYKIDRLSRNTYDYATLKVLFTQLGIKIVSVTENIDDTPVGRFVENTLAGVSQLDNDIRSERSKNGMIDAVKAGRYTWRAPLGYINTKVNGQKYIPPSSDEKMVGFIRRIWELIDAGYRPEAARRVVSKEGLRCKNGKAISKSHFYSMLTNKVYKGVIEKFGLYIISGEITPIINPDLFDRVSFILSGKKRATQRYSRLNPQFPLRETLICRNGHIMTGSYSTGRSSRYPYYHCPQCRGLRTSYRRDKVEVEFRQLLDSYQYDPELKDVLITAIESNWEHQHKENRTRIRYIENQIAVLKAKRDQLVEKNLRGIISDYDTRELLDRNNLTIAELKIELDQYSNFEENTIEVVEYGLAVLGNLGAVWDQLEDLEIKQRFQKFLFPSGLSYDGQYFGTAVLPLCIRTKDAILDKKFALVAHTGFATRCPKGLFYVQTRTFVSIAQTPFYA